jgi:hypothetical protein
VANKCVWKTHGQSCTCIHQRTDLFSGKARLRSLTDFLYARTCLKRFRANTRTFMFDKHVGAYMYERHVCSCVPPLTASINHLTVNCVFHSFKNRLQPKFGKYKKTTTFNLSLFFSELFFTLFKKNTCENGTTTSRSTNK